jgi:hypothetical protein
VQLQALGELLDGVDFFRHGESGPRLNVPYCSLSLPD